MTKTTKKHRNRRSLWIIISAVTALAAAAVVFVATHVRLDGAWMPLGTQEVKISSADEQTVRKLARLRSLRAIELDRTCVSPDSLGKIMEVFPEAAVSFTAPLSAGDVPSDAASVRILTKEDAAYLPFLTALKSVVLTDRSDTDAVDAVAVLLERETDLQVYYLDSGKEILLTGDQTEADFSELDPDGFSAVLTFLKPETAVLLPEDASEELRTELSETYPDLVFPVPGGEYGQDLSVPVVIGADTDGEALFSVLDGISPLSTVDLTEYPTDPAFLQSLVERYPEMTFLFHTELYGVPVTPETEILILDEIIIDDLETVEAVLSASGSIREIDMCGCGIPDTEMTHLRDRHPDVKVVWTVDLRNWTVRTDITHFATWKVKTDEEGYIVSARNIGGNTSESLAPLQYCTDLIALDLGHNRIRDLSFLSGLTNLKYLILALNEITDLTPLSQLKELKYLEIFSNENITDISPLAELGKLEALCMSDTKVTDISPLYGLQSLRRLYLQGYRFDQDARKEIAAALPECTVLYKTLGSTGSDWRKCDYYPEMRKALGWRID